MTEQTTAPAMSADEVLAVIDELIAVPVIECVDDEEFAARTNQMRSTVAAMIAEREEQAGWIAHLSAFIGPSAMPNIRKSFEEGRAPGGACVARAEGCGNG